MLVLGVNGGLSLEERNPGAALAIDGRIVAACEEERYSRILSAPGHFPLRSIRACLEVARVTFEDIALIVLPILDGDGQITAIRELFTAQFGSCPAIELVGKQVALAACAFYSSGLSESLVVSVARTTTGSFALLANATKEFGIRTIGSVPFPLAAHEYAPRPGRIPGVEGALWEALEGLRRVVPGARHLCIGGDLAFDGVSSFAIHRSNVFEAFFVSPLAGDRGLAIGSAYLGAAMLGHGKWQLWDTYLGSWYSDAEIRGALERSSGGFEVVDDPCLVAARMLASGMTVGWYQGRAEAGGRALGNRSILARPEGSRAPDRLAEPGDGSASGKIPARLAVLKEHAGDWVDVSREPSSPFMTLALPIRSENLAEFDPSAAEGAMWLHTVSSTGNELFYDLLYRYWRMTGLSGVVSGDLALEGRPLAETPEDALGVFRASGLDALLIGNCLVTKGGHGGA